MAVNRGWAPGWAEHMDQMIRHDKLIESLWKSLTDRYAELHTRSSHDKKGGYTHDSPNVAAREEPDYPRMNDGCYWRRPGSRANKAVGDWIYM